METILTQKGTGALLDNRNSLERLRDFRFEESITAPDPVSWREKSESEWRKFPIFNQNGSGSCVAQSMAKLLGINYFLENGSYVHFSASHIYKRRMNRPTAGMLGYDAFKIAQSGVTLEELTPSQEMNDEEMDSIDIPEYKQKVGELFKIKNYLQFNAGDIDKVASIIQRTKKGVMVWFYWMPEEWMNIPVVKYPSLLVEKAYRHSVVAVDYTLYKGEKAIIIEDSWGSSYGLAGQRIITESFFKQRNFFCAYPMNFSFSGTNEPPYHSFSRPLEFDITLSKIDVDVASLQEILKYEGLFPTNLASSGIYGAVTANAVLKFQKKYFVDSDIELDKLQGRRVGAKTLSVLNRHYGL